MSDFPDTSWQPQACRPIWIDAREETPDAHQVSTATLDCAIPERCKINIAHTFPDTAPGPLSELQRAGAHPRVGTHRDIRLRAANRGSRMARRVPARRADLPPARRRRKKAGHPRRSKCSSPINISVKVTAHRRPLQPAELQLPREEPLVKLYFVRGWATGGQGVVPITRAELAYLVSAELRALMVRLPLGGVFLYAEHQAERRPLPTASIPPGAGRHGRRVCSTVSDRGAPGHGRHVAGSLWDHALWAAAHGRMKAHGTAAVIGKGRGMET